MPSNCSTSVNEMKLCKLFNGYKGSCRFGERCKFSHVMPGGQPPPPPRENRTHIPRFTEFGKSSSTTPLQVLARHAAKLNLCMEEMNEMIESGIKSLSIDQESAAAICILAGEKIPGSGGQGKNNFKSHIDRIMAKFSSDSAQDAAKTFSLLILPVLRLLSHSSVRDGIFSESVNPLYSQVSSLLDKGKLASFYQKLAKGEEPLTQGQSWIEVIEPTALTLHELLSRFQGDEAFRRIKDDSYVCSFPSF